MDPITAAMLLDKLFADGADSDGFPAKVGKNTHAALTPATGAHGLARAPAIANATAAHAVGAVYTQAEMNTVLNALGATINSLLAALRAAGLVAP